MAHEFHSFYYDQLKEEPATDDFVLPSGTEMDGPRLRALIDEHVQSHLPRLRYLGAAYETRYTVFDMEAKPDWKPDNRLAADMAYDITETFEGYFIGIPIDVKTGEDAKDEYIASYIRRNNQEDTDADLSKMASKFGLSYEMMYQDDEGRPRSVAVSPLTSFMVYDESVLKRKMYFVRYGYGEDGKLQGSFSDARRVVRFREEGEGIALGDAEEHYFGDVPAVCFAQNTERRGLYEGVLNLIEAYNRALSEKANDVEYFADAYMVVEGVELPDDYKEDLRSHRLINLYNTGTSSDQPIVVKFLEKPDADVSQENLINRLEMLIFKMAMVPDITDESFSTASGTALKMRLMPMSNLARNKERKFVMGVRERMRLLANYPDKPFSGDDWERVEIAMHRNMPEDVASEADVAASLSGIVSEETQLSLLSCVDDPKAEMERKAAEKEERAKIAEGIPTNRTKREPTMYEITSILNQRKRGQLTYSNALAMMRRIGVDEADAIEYLDSKE